jgi:crossover junction endodeoxyribonuclease RuvC
VVTQAPLRVLGLDPGLTRCGVGVVEGHPSQPHQVAHACVRTDPSLAVADRLRRLHEQIAELIDLYRPSAVAVEEVLFSANVRTAMATGQAAGVAMLAGAQAGVPVATYTPTQVKLTVAGDGAADKGAVARMVVAQLRLDAAPRPVDVTDALAVALTHLARNGVGATTLSVTGPSTALAEAHASARRAGRGGWAAVLAERTARMDTSRGGHR